MIFKIDIRYFAFEYADSWQRLPCPCHSLTNIWFMFLFLVLYIPS